MNKTYYIVMQRCRDNSGSIMGGGMSDFHYERVLETSENKESAIKTASQSRGSFIIEAQETRRFDVETTFTEKEIK